MMYLKLVAVVLITVTSLLNSFSSYSQDFEYPTFQKFDEAFPNRPVNDLLVDSNGFLWIGTYGAGVYRTDGISYDAFRFDQIDSNSINNDFVLSLLEDTKGRIWVGTERGLNIYDPLTEKFSRIKLTVKGNEINGVVPVMQMHMKPDGTIILSNNGISLVILSINDQQRILSDPIIVEYRTQNLQITEIVEDKYGRIYASSNLGLLQFSDDINDFAKPEYIKDKEALSVPMESIAVKDGKLWLGTSGNGLLEARINDSEVIYIKEHKVTSKRILDIQNWGEDYLICATENDGLIRFNSSDQSFEKYLHTNSREGSIESNSIWKLELDKANRLWLGYYNRGIGLFDPNYNKFEVIKHQFDNKNSLSSNSVNSLAVIGNDKLWIGMDGGGVDLFNFKSRTFNSLSAENGYYGLDNKSVQSVIQDEGENLWVGTWGSGIYHLKKGSKYFKNLDKNKNPDMNSMRFMKFVEGKDHIYCATFGGGVHVIDKKNLSVKQLVTSVMREPDVRNADIRDILLDSNDNLWVGSTIGLFVLHFEGQDTVLRSFNTDFAGEIKHHSFNHILSLFEDHKGHIWIGTDGAGLYCYYPEIDSVMQNQELLKTGINSITAITEDNQKNIWLTSKLGIAMINQQNGQVVHYTKEDGLSSNDFNYGAIAKLSDGSVLFGSVDGLNIMNTNDHKLNSQEVIVYLSQLKLFNQKVNVGDSDSPLSKPLSQTKSITLSSDQSVFSIEYTGVNFTRPNQIQFAYYLDGLENDWNYVGSQRSANYTTLQPGDYTFRLKAANNDGVWSEEVLELGIIVLPPWYKSNVAFLCYILLFLVLLYSLYLILRVRIKERQEVISERERRTQGEELNQKKLQFFTNISHEFRTPLTLILSPINSLLRKRNVSPDVERKLLIVQRNAKRLERLIDELMDFRKLNSGKLKIHVHHIDLYGFAKEIARYFQVDADEREIKLHVSGDQSSHMAWVDSGLVEKMLFNLLSNAFKVTPDSGEITINLSVQETEFDWVENGKIQSLRLSISDTGPGLSEDHLQRIFDRFYQVERMNKWYFGGTGIGLEVVRSFIGLHKGKVEVESEEGHGTTFHLYFPLGKNHFQEEDIVTGEYPGKKEFLTPQVDKVTLEDDELDELLTDHKKPSILVVDDNSELRNYMVSELKDHYYVETAKNGLEGLEKANNSQPDLIITDVIMPEMDGYEFCEKIKKELSTSHIPLIMLTAKSATKDHIYGMDKGADGYITKPFEMPLLETQIKQLLKSRQVLFDKYMSGISEMENAANTTSADRDFLQKVITYISENISDSKLSVELLASEVTLSRSQLYRKMKSLTGLNVNEFIRRIRLEQAKKMITSGDVNINEVCYQVGFSSASYFTKCYKEYFGVVPNKQKKS